jgi:hypothetical protein
MKTTLLLSTLAIGLLGATSAFAQAAETTGPSYPYPSYAGASSPAFGFPSYAEPGAGAPSFGPNDYGYYQGRSQRTRTH